MNVTKGPRNSLPFRNTGIQISTKYSINPKISLMGKLWYSNSYLATTENPTVNDDILANSPPTGEVKAIALPIDQLELFETGQPFNAGSATFIPNQIDPDSRRMGNFYTGVITFQHQLTRTTSYQLEYQGVSTSRVYEDGPAGPGSFEPAATIQNSFNGYTNAGQAHIEQKAGRHNRISGGYDYERERYVTLNGTYSAPSSTGSTRFKQRSSSFYVQDLISLADGRLQMTVGGRAQVFNLKVPQFSGYTTSPYQDAPLITPPLPLIQQTGRSPISSGRQEPSCARTRETAIVRLRAMSGLAATVEFTMEIRLSGRNARLRATQASIRN